MPASLVMGAGGLISEDGNAMAAKFEIYKGKIGDFHWKLIHTNGRVIAKSDEGYTTKVNAINSLNSVKGNAPNAIVEDKTVRNPQG
jgi:uncharacterized protein YegP (UPF0339 family)